MSWWWIADGQWRRRRRQRLRWRLCDWGKNGVRLPNSLGDGALRVCGWMMGNCCLLWCWKWMGLRGGGRFSRWCGM